MKFYPTNNNGRQTPENATPNAQSSDKRTIYSSIPYNIHILCVTYQLLASSRNDPRRFFDLFLSQVPVACFDCISDGWEVGTVVARPEVGTEDDVFELCAVRDLLPLVNYSAKGKETYSATLLQI